jgi:pentapeptide repeat protein
LTPGGRRDRRGPVDLPLGTRPDRPDPDRADLPSRDLASRDPASRDLASRDLASRDPDRADLRADCARCAGLCCVAPAFTRSADFALDKPAGRPCPNLQPDCRCGIHDSLRDRGFPGCTVFDCFGAGQHVVQGTFAGRDWRADPAIAEAMFAAFGVLRQLHELLWQLTGARGLAAGSPLDGDLEAALSRTRTQAGLDPGALGELDVAAARRETGALLEQVADLARQRLLDRPPGSRTPDHRGADLMGADLTRTDLRGAVLRGAYLIGADLRGADLLAADLLGADLRAADVRGTDLAGALFLTQPQLEAARGDGGTTLPAWAVRPAHWPSGRDAGPGQRTGRRPPRQGRRR